MNIQRRIYAPGSARRLAVLVMPEASCGRTRWAVDVGCQARMIESQLWQQPKFDQLRAGFLPRWRLMLAALGHEEAAVHLGAMSSLMYGVRVWASDYFDPIRREMVFIAALQRGATSDVGVGQRSAGMCLLARLQNVKAHKRPQIGSRILDVAGA